MKAKIFTIACLALANVAFGQNYWSKTSKTISTNLAERWLKPTEFSVYQVNLENLKADLAKVPQRFSKDESHVMTFPGTDGIYREYIVQEASVMAPELQAKFPEIRSYVAWQKNKPENMIRFSVTPDQGISIMYFDGWEISYLDKYTNDNQNYILYKRNDLPENDRIRNCNVEGIQEEAEEISLKAPLVSDGLFRTYRLALACTGEYAQYHGGTVAGAMSAMATTMTRVNGVYEKTISVTMQMIANNNLLIYTNGSTDPYTNNDGGTMLSENQTNIDSVIGFANYDIGHVFSTGGGGVAYLGSICRSNKAGGVTGSSAPVNDAFDIDYVAHEMGHQFGGSHTFRASTGSCSGNASNATAYEPGSGTTIMAYAGICGTNNNVQLHSDPYFHNASVAQMYTVIRRATDCSVKVSNNNQVPTADAGADYYIPKSTAFVLTGVGTDPDNDPITYLWEQMDSQSNTQPPVSTATVGPVYRSVLPTSSPSRYFPALSSVLARNLVPKWEVTPSVARDLNFALLVNDNKATGNQSARDMMIVTVTNDGPFAVTSQASTAAQTANTPITITWNVAGTNAGDINTQNVQILLSTNGGTSFDTVLAASTPNDGTETITLPNVNATAARIMIKAVGNIYYAVNGYNFPITGAAAVNDVNNSKFEIYPNPARNEVFVKLSAANNSGTYSLSDASGRLLKKGRLDAETRIDVNSVKSGVYFITVNLADGTAKTEKVIIRK